MKAIITPMSCSKSMPYLRPLGPASLALAATVAFALAVPAYAEIRPDVIPFSELGARVTLDYNGDALSISATSDGARLRCGFQKLQAHASSEGLWLESTGLAASGKLRLIATHVGRDTLFESNSEIRSEVKFQPGGRLLTSLAATGAVSVEGKLIRFKRPSLTEEYSVSVDGVRQDFIIAARPAGAGDLLVELALIGARAEAASYGARLRMEGSERTLAYSRLRAVDAGGKELTARLEVLAADRLVVQLADANATYPVRIDPTFSDADWVSMNPGLYGANNWVYAVAVDSGGNVYVGGDFTLVGTVLATNIAKWNGSAWSALGSGMGGSYPCVYALAVSGTDLYVGGQFTTAGGVPANCIAKWNGSAWSALGSGMACGCSVCVYALAVNGTDLYAGGDFTQAGGVWSDSIAKWNGSAWSALGSGLYFGVRALAVSGTDLYVGGNFTSESGAPVPLKYVAKWNGSAWSALGSGMVPGASGDYRSSVVGALAIIGTDLYAGGTFTAAGGVAATNLAKWNGSAWSALGSGANGEVKGLAVSGTDLYAGGNFTVVGGVPANCIAKWDGNAWSALGSGMRLRYPCVYALTVGGTNLYTGGTFTTAGGVAANNIAKWNGSTWLPLSSWITGLNDAVYATVVSGTDLYAGGYFTTAGGLPANYIAKWNGSAWSALGSGMDSYVLALALSGTNLYAGGVFTTAGGVTANYIAKWDGSSWSGLGSGVDGTVRALVVVGTNLYAGGAFKRAGGAPAVLIAKWNGSGWSPLGSGLGDANGGVNALARLGSDLYVGGQFTTLGGVSANCIAKWDGSTWFALGSGLNRAVSALALSGTDLYAGGYFTTAGGVPANYIAKWNGSVWSPLGLGVVGGGFYPSVTALAISSTNLYAGGLFTNAGGVPANNVARWNGNAWSALGSGTDGYVEALAADRAGHLFVGGQFLLAGTKVSPYIALAIPLASPPSILTQPQTQTAEQGATVLLTGNAVGDPSPVYQWFLNGGTALVGATTSILQLSHVQFAHGGAYTVVVTNMFGAATSSPALLSVIAPVEHRPVPALTLMGQWGSFVNLDSRTALDSSANWETLDTVPLTNASQPYFDLTVPFAPQRFYRAWQTNAPSPPSVRDVHLVPAITLTGAIGSSVRIDYINQFGPIDAWLTLDTVTLINTTQLYFDTSSIGQPARLYRIVPVP